MTSETSDGDPSPPVQLEDVVPLDEPQPKQQQQQQAEKTNKPRSSSSSTMTNPFSQLYRLLNFSLIMWVVPLVRSGFKTPLPADRVPERSPIHRAQHMVERAEFLWAEEVARKGKKASLIKVMFKLQRYTLITGTLVSIAQGLLFSVARPLLLRQLILTVSKYEETTVEESIIIAIIFSLVVLFDGVLQVCVKQLLFAGFGCDLIAWTSSIVQRKAATVSPVAAASSHLSGEALVGHDAMRLFEDLRWLSVFPFAVTTILGGVGILIYTLGAACIAGFIVIIAITVATLVIARTLKKVELLDLSVGDLRLGLMKEIIYGVKAIKMMAWEVPFQEMLNDARDKESDLIRRFRTLQVTSINMGRASPILSASASIFVLATLGDGKLQAEDIFAAISAFQSMRLPLISLPHNLSQMGNYLNSFQRFSEYLLLDDLSVTEKMPDGDECALRITDASFTWVSPTNDDEVKDTKTKESTKGKKKKGKKDNESPAKETTKEKTVKALSSRYASAAEPFGMTNLSLSLPRHGSLTAVVGRVGSGKTSLLSSFLGALHRTEGTVEVVEQIGYVPQKAPVLSGTLLENIVMGLDLDAARLDLALASSALTADVEQFPRGIHTEVGERGQTLSGGQQQRLSIARALYSDPELLVMDDPLSAVDPGVATSIFRRAVLAYVLDLNAAAKTEQGVEIVGGVVHSAASLMDLDNKIIKSLLDLAPRRRNRTAIMAINQLHLLPEFDSIVVMEGGKIVEQGSYDELMAKPKGALAMMLNGLELTHLDDDMIPTSDEAEANGSLSNVSTSNVDTPTRSPPRSPAIRRLSHAARDDDASSVSSSSSLKNRWDPIISGREASSGAPGSEYSELIEAQTVADRRQSLDDMQSAMVAKAAVDASEEGSEGGDGNNNNNNNNRTDLGNLVENDAGAKGAVAKGVLVDYFRAMGFWHLPVAMSLAFTAYGLLAANDLWLASWVERSSNQDSPSPTNLESAGAYLGFSIGHIIFVQILSLANTAATVRAGKRVHRECVEHLLHAPISWFESTPSGRIISRFSGDLGMVDRMLAFIFDDCFQFFFLLLALFVVVCYIITSLIPVVFIGIIVFGFQLLAVDRTNREVKRYANQALAPVLTNISETVGSREIIQVMKYQRFFCERHWKAIDEYCRFNYCSASLVHWGSLISLIISFFLSSCAAMIVVFQRETFDPSLVGLALTYSFLIPYFLGILSMVLPIGFTALTSLERVLEYKGPIVPSEPSWYRSEVDKSLVPAWKDREAIRDVVATAESTTASKTDDIESGLAKDKKKKKKGGTITVPEANLLSQVDWPTQGRVEFEDVTLVYRPGLPPAIRNVSVVIEGQSKVGIVGRTGAGKSSLTMLLFRVNDARSGRILVDGQDITQMGLQLLRTSLTIIPQSPLLLGGSSIKENLDPFTQHTDAQHRIVMEKVGLDPDLLDSEDNKATSLSVGERQMLSLARVLLRPNLRVVVLDEPTSNVDVRTDEQMQRVVREEFKHSTVLTIAHRLNTIIDCDKILVMDKGKVSQYGPAAELYKDKNGILHQMITGMGDEAAKQLMSKAKKID